MKQWLLIFSVLFMSACTMTSGVKLKQARISRQFCQLGETKVIIQKEDYGPGKTFIHPHADEVTALEAARLIARSSGGKVITLIHEKSRLIRFTVRGRGCQFDPNRVFTPRGVEENLKLYGCDSKENRIWVSRFAHQFLAFIPPGKVVAVHNNKQYSLKYYLPHQSLASDAAQLYVNPRVYYRNFFLVTRAKDFNVFRQRGFNVVLQSSLVKDDGSLSVFLANRQYVNVEAGYGQLFYQMRMLQAA